MRHGSGVNHPRLENITPQIPEIFTGVPVMRKPQLQGRQTRSQDEIAADSRRRSNTRVPLLSTTTRFPFPSFVSSTERGPDYLTQETEMLTQSLLFLTLLPLLVLGQDGSINGPTTSAEAAGYSCDTSKCQLPKCNCASPKPPGGLNPVRPRSPSLTCRFISLRWAAICSFAL